MSKRTSQPSTTDLALSPSASLSPAVLRDYLTLTKPEISFLVTISALAGFLLGAPGAFNGWTLFFLLIGVALTSAGACVLNHYVEMDLDAQMKRTATRPLPSGRLAPKAARNFGYVLVAAGVGLLCPLTNPLTATLAGLTVVLYLYVYTPLKRKTTLNTLIGTIPGALPALGGWTAATGSIGGSGLAIFAVLAFWQMPHFFSLAWMYRKDYGRGGYAMLPVVKPDGQATAFQTVAYTVALIGASIVPTLLGNTGLLYAGAAFVLGLWFLRPTITFYRTRTVHDARRVLKASIVYIPMLVLLILLDRWMPF